MRNLQIKIFQFLFDCFCFILKFRYLNDWKEQACLKTDELNTLFGNIQQVYDFNVILLGELELSGMDPAKIAKCFIKLKDKFDAYTHYW